MKKVSIIVPLYNAEKAIDSCITSILKQDYKNIEVILINDGSNDRSMDICSKYELKYECIKLWSQANKGPSAARNFGINKATGEYIQFIDIDDTVSSNMTSKLVKALEQVESDLVICGYKTFFKNNGITSMIETKPYVHGFMYKEVFLNNFGYFYKDLLIHTPWNKLYRTNIIRKNKIKFDEDIRLGEDLLFNLSYLTYSFSVNVIKSTPYFYKVNKVSLSRGYNDKLFFLNKKLYFEVKEYMVKERALNTFNNNMIDEKFYISIIMNYEKLLFI